MVIDGVPMDQTASKSLGGGISEVNPDNIKESRVLKGPNAAALYGSRAANGVILITTKTGRVPKVWVLILTPTSPSSVPGSDLTSRIPTAGEMATGPGITMAGAAR